MDGDNNADPVVVRECPTGTTCGAWWVAECADHSWFKEVSSDAFFAGMHADRHRRTYHKRWKK